MTKTDTTTITNDTKTTQTVSGMYQVLMSCRQRNSLHQNMSGTRKMPVPDTVWRGHRRKSGTQRVCCRVKKRNRADIPGRCIQEMTGYLVLKPGLQQLQIGISGEGGMLSGVKNCRPVWILLRTSLSEDTPEHISINSALKGISEGLTELPGRDQRVCRVSGAADFRHLESTVWTGSKLTAQNSTLRNVAKA